MGCVFGRLSRGMRAGDFARFAVGDGVTGMCVKGKVHSKTMQAKYLWSGEDGEEKWSSKKKLESWGKAKKKETTVKSLRLLLDESAVNLVSKLGEMCAYVCCVWDDHYVCTLRRAHVCFLLLQEVTLTLTSWGWGNAEGRGWREIVSLGVCCQSVTGRLLTPTSAAEGR